MEGRVIFIIFTLSMHNVYNIRVNYKLQSDIEVQSRFFFLILFLKSCFALYCCLYKTELKQFVVHFIIKSEMQTDNTLI